MSKETVQFAKFMSKLCKIKKYIGKYVIVVGGNKVVSFAQNQYEAFKKAKNKFPKEQLGIFYVPKAEETLTCLCNILIQK